MVVKEMVSVVDVGGATRLHLVTREEKPSFVICGPSKLVDETLLEMGIDPLDSRGVSAAVGCWTDIAFFSTLAIESQDAHRVVRSFGIEDCARLR